LECISLRDFASLFASFAVSPHGLTAKGAKKSQSTRKGKVNQFIEFLKDGKD
jgi:hypothetical protein